MLYFTSFLFGGVAFYAILEREYLVGCLFQLLYGNSILHHANYTNPDAYAGGHLVKQCDRLLARFLVCTMIYKLSRLRFDKEVLLLWLAIVYLPSVYFSVIPEDPYPRGGVKTEMLWHASIHVAASFAMCLYLRKRGQVAL